MELVTTSGAKVVINQAPFEDVSKLHRALLREAALVGGQLNIATILMTVGSEQVDALLWPCLARSLYEPVGQSAQKIVKSTFDALSNRQDFYEVISAFGEVNIIPLVDSLRSQLQKYGLIKAQANTGKDQSSELMTTSPSSP